MESNKVISIYIDNTGSQEDIDLGLLLKKRIKNLNLDVTWDIQSFGDLPESDNHNDANNEANTVAAINNSLIVIPIISQFYVNYVTPNIEKSINDVINSSDRYLFPILLDNADWSNHDWVVKSPVTPEDSKPLLHHTESEQEKYIHGLVSKIMRLVASLKPDGKIIKEDVPNIGSTNEFVFISHDHDDADFAELLKLRLEKEGIQSWLDTDRLKIGQDWREEIDQGIENSTAVIAIMTPEARKSEYVTYEWAFAWGKGKLIFPIMLKQTQLHPRLESLQYLNFTSNPSRPWDELISSIKGAIK